MLRDRSTRLTLNLDRQAQVRHSAAVERNRMSAPIGRSLRVLLEVLPDLTGPSGDNVRRGLPESSINAQLRIRSRKIRDTRRVKQESMTDIVPESWRQWGQAQRGIWPRCFHRPTCWLRMTPYLPVPGNLHRVWARWVHQGRNAAHTATGDDTPPRTKRPAVP